MACQDVEIKMLMQVMKEETLEKIGAQNQQ
jgi:hypothetical protein